MSVAPLNETLDEDDEKRLMEEVLASSYQQYKRPRMPISYLKGTSMMAHDPGPGVKPSWCHPRRTMKLGVPIWNRPVTERERLAPPGSTHRPGAGVGSSAGVGASRRSAAGGAAVRPSTVGSGRTGSSVRGRGRSGRSVASTTSNWSRRSPGSRGSSRSFDTVRNGTSLNMPSFHRLPKGHPQSILYSALFPHMPISHIQRPGSAELSSVWQHTRQKQRTVRWLALPAFVDADKLAYLDDIVALRVRCVVTGSNGYASSWVPSQEQEHAPYLRAHDRRHISHECAAVVPTARV